MEACDMKVLLIGSSDPFAMEWINRLGKEGHTVGLVAITDFLPQARPTLSYHWFGFAADSPGLDKAWASFKPDRVVFAGRLFGDAEWDMEQAATPYLGELANCLHLAAKHQAGHFIYLSTMEVYPPRAPEAQSLAGSEESDDLQPESVKGLLCLQGEKLSHEFCRIHKLDLSIVRYADLGGYGLAAQKNDVISTCARQLSMLSEVTVNTRQTYHLLSLGDAVDALVRMIHSGRPGTYNVSSTRTTPAIDLYAKVKEITGSSTVLVRENGSPAHYPADVTAIKRELEWVELRPFEDQLPEWVQADLAPKPLKRSRPMRIRASSLPGQILQTGLFFVVMAWLSRLVSGHDILRQIDLMTVFVLTTSLFFGVQHGVLAVLLAFGYYVAAATGNSSEILHVILKPDTFLRLAYLIFAGVVVGYAVDQYRKAAGMAQTERDYLQNEFSELKRINDSNVMIKHQYEKRLVSYRNSLPRLYDITRQLDSLDPRVIYSSLVNVIQDVMEVQAVAVYTFDRRSGYTRLIGALNERSLFQGKSFKLADFPALADKLGQNEIFIGDQWSESSPALAGAIHYQGQILALIIIRELPFEMMSLYQVNLLRTLIALISSSFIKAFQYEGKTRGERFLGDSEIFVAAEFAKSLRLSQDDKNKQQADFSVLRLPGALLPEEVYH
ncbi:MAG: NAD(P)-dependent oxidoreductase, partial [Clostridia bacterium]|nr:NAD(P)-dependent oxidoreductase [Clostridia bacterium]